MLTRLAAAALLAGALAPTLAAQTTLIDFETLTLGDPVSSQFPEVTFSSEPAHGNFVQDIGLSNGKFLCTGPIVGVITCLQDTYVDFSVPVDDLSLLAVEANYPAALGPAARIRVFESGVQTSTVDVFGLGGPGNVPVDLTGFSNVTRIEIFDIVDDPTLENGIGWDDFAFTPVFGAPYCFGDGSGTSCPCANNSPMGSGQGCQNVTGAGGLISASGTPSVAADDLTITAATSPPRTRRCCSWARTRQAGVPGSPSATACCVSPGRRPASRSSSPTPPATRPGAPAWRPSEVGPRETSVRCRSGTATTRAVPARRTPT